MNNIKLLPQSSEKINIVISESNEGTKKKDEKKIS